MNYDVVIIGLSITSSWGNGHATTYRSLARGLGGRGHRVLFLEHDTPWYADNRDTPQPRGATTRLYSSFEELIGRFEADVRDARLVILGSYVQDGARVGDWVTSIARGRTAFYDIDTPVTLAQLEQGETEHITPALIRRFSAYFSFTGGPTLRYLESHYGAPMARVLYCSVDTDRYRPLREPKMWDLGYLGTYSDDRQPALDTLLLEPARQWRRGAFAVVGALYPDDIVWPPNVYRETHISPREHAAFYARQCLTLNITREEMKKRGFSPSVRLFEAGACGAAIVSDWWVGLSELFVPGREVLISESADQTLRYLRDQPKSRLAEIGLAARRRILAEHTAEHRAIQLENYLKEIDANALPYTSRRNGHSRPVADGLDSWMSSESNGHGPSRKVGGEAIDISNHRHLYQPIGAGRGNGSADRLAKKTATPAVESPGRVAPGRVGGRSDNGTGST